MSRALTCLALSAGLIALLFLPAYAQPIELDYLLVKLSVAGRGAAALNHAQEILTRYGPNRVEALLTPGWFRVFAPARILDRMQARLADDPAILTVERDGLVQAMLTPDDPGWSYQWGPLKIDAPGAWEYQTGNARVIVAVVDTGIDLGHPDLATQLWVNPGEISGDGLDNDGNGFVDDIHGWRFLSGEQSNNVQDDNGHGTHVAGIVGARGNNGLGVAGVCWNCRLMILKALNSMGSGTHSDVAAAITYAADNGARIVNLSLGAPTGLPILEDAINDAAARGVLIVAATGNYGSRVYYPGAYEAAFAVAATDQVDKRASYSNSGPEVDIAAPGSNIYSTCIDDSYCYKKGTSMATPHVSGLAGLIWSVQYTLTPIQVRQIITGTAVDVESPGWDPFTGWGRIDARRALQIALEAQTSVYIYYFPLMISP